MQRMEPATLVTAGFFAGLVIVGALLFLDARARSAAKLEAAAKLDTAKSGASAVSGASAAAETALAEADAVEAARAPAVSRAEARSALLGRADRDSWIRQCVATLGCKQWQTDAIIGGAPAAERPHALRVSNAAVAEDTARRQGVDRSTPSIAAVRLISDMVAQDDMGLSMLDMIPATTMAVARTHPDLARGKILTASGTIIDIHQAGELVEGSLTVGNKGVLRFVTSMSTSGLQAGKTSTFKGVFVQQYASTDPAAGQAESLLAVGAFDIPENQPVR
jgi:hypothetical protein